MNWITVFAVWMLLLLSPGVGQAEESCSACHKDVVKGPHANLECVSCHGEQGEFARPASMIVRASGCVACHSGTENVFDGPMSTRTAENDFVERTYGKADPHFYQKNCQQCHVTDCLDCHGGKGHEIAAPRQGTCLSCHKGYFVGGEYYGMAPREDAQRYQRGKKVAGETFLKMRPDTHYEEGLLCGDCHSMDSLAAGQRTGKNCRDCHQPSERVLEHRIGAHMEGLECYACHSAWAAQEYGTFYIRINNSKNEKLFRVRRLPNSDYVKSSYLKMQNRPPLGVNEKGRISPIRPQFISYFTEIDKDLPVGEENRLLGAEWKTFFPHTVQAGTVMCDGCHNDSRRFLQEKSEDRIYLTEEEGLGLPSFWSTQGQSVINGTFMPVKRFEQMSEKTPAFRRAYVEKWKSLVENVENSSK